MHLDETQRFFLNILRYYLSGILPDTSLNSICWDRLYQYANQQELVVIIDRYVQTLNIDENIRKRFKQSAVAHVFYSVNQSKDYQDVKSELEQAGIQFVPIKGVVLQDYYMNAVDRSMGDVDILIHESDASTVKDIMKSTGHIINSGNDDQWTYKKNNGIYYEFHRDLVHTVNSDEDISKQLFFNDFWKYVDGNELEWSFHFLFLLMHLRGHLIGSGAGFRHFFDIALLLTRVPEKFDWKWIEHQANRIGLLEFFHTVIELCRRWFAIVVPVEVESVDDDFFETVTTKIFEDGVFGAVNDNNSISIIAKKQRGSFAILKIKSVIELLFPSYKSLASAEKYAYVRNKPWLLPLAWGRRMASAAKSKHSRKQLSLVIKADKESIENRRDILRKWHKK